VDAGRKSEHIIQFLQWKLNDNINKKFNVEEEDLGASIMEKKLEPCF